jgi:hypothetical protein
MPLSRCPCNPALGTDSRVRVCHSLAGCRRSRSFRAAFVILLDTRFLLPSLLADDLVASLMLSSLLCLQTDYGITHISYLIDGNMDIFPFDCEFHH